MPNKPKIFYGYWVILASFMCLVVCQGTVWWAFSLFVKYIQAELNWGRSAIYIAFSIYSLTMGTTAPFIGRLVDRYGARQIIVAGALVSGIGLTSLMALQNLWHLYVAYFFLGAGATAMGHVVQSSIVSRWFQRKRGTAIGLMATGVGVGGFTLAPIIGNFIIPTLGWRASYLALAIITWAIIIPLALLVIKSSPAEMGLYPDGITPAEVKAAPAASAATTKKRPALEGFTFQAALATSTFWLIVLSFITSAFSQATPMQNEVNFLTDIGFTAGLAATIHGFVGLGSAAGKFSFGWLCDRIQPKYAAVLGHLLVIGALLIMLNLSTRSPAFLLWTYGALLGLGLGSWLPTMSMLVSTNFGLAAYGVITGLVSFAQSLGTSSGPLVSNIIRDATGSYNVAFILCICIYAIAMPAILLVRRPKAKTPTG